MRSVSVLVALAALCGVEATTNSTVVCPNCTPASSTPDVVTRSAVPSTPCTGPSLTAIYSSTATGLTTSTVYTTSVHTITSCAPTVTNCPVGKVTTEVISYTTVCPVSGASSGAAVPTGSGGMGSSPSETTGIVPVTAGANKAAAIKFGSAAAAIVVGWCLA